MEDNTFGIIIVTLFIIVYVAGIGSVVVSFFFDPKEIVQSLKDTRYYKVTSSEYHYNTEDDEPASVIISEVPLFEYDENN